MNLGEMPFPNFGEVPISTLFGETPISPVFGNTHTDPCKAFGEMPIGIISAEFHFDCVKTQTL